MGAFGQADARRSGSRGPLWERNPDMTMTYRIDVDCANCAREMEEAAARCRGVVSVIINPITQKITVTFAEGADPASAMREVLRVCRKVEPDCVIVR